jgi:ATP-dependent DNA helicase Q1
MASYDLTIDGVVEAAMDGVAETELELDIKDAETALAETESTLVALIAKRDAQRQCRDRLLQRREREAHTTRQACEAAGVSSTADLSRETADGMRNGTWSGAFDWDARVAALLGSPFGCSEFRPFQREVINATLAGRDCFVVMRTGGGKSLTYQLPALLQGGITLVVSPLLSLISDQVRAMNLRSPGRAAALTSTTDRSEAAAIHRAFKGSGSSSSSNNCGTRTDDVLDSLRLVYVTPERVSKSKQLMAAMEAADKRGALTRFVVDEAHCCSQW